MFYNEGASSLITSMHMASGISHTGFFNYLAPNVNQLQLHKNYLQIITWYMYSPMPSEFFTFL